MKWLSWTDNPIRRQQSKTVPLQRGVILTLQVISVSEDDCWAPAVRLLTSHWTQHVSLTLITRYLSQELHWKDISKGKFVCLSEKYPYLNWLYLQFERSSSSKHQSVQVIRTDHDQLVLITEVHQHNINNFTGLKMLKSHVAFCEE